MKSSEVSNILDKLYPDAECELEYNKDYELLIAVVLSAQSTDKRVNEVTKVLFSKYDIFSLSLASLNDIKQIIYPVGTYNKKAQYIIDIADSLVKNYNGVVPCNREYLESLPGVGRKTANVVLSNIYNIPAFAVDTHVARVSNRLGIVSSKDVSVIEKELMDYFPESKWIRTHHQLVLFGRYICKSIKPQCEICPFNKCKYKK